MIFLHLIGILLIAWITFTCLQTYGVIGPTLPPGPTPLPFLGNVLDLPRSREYLKYSEWGRKYGDVTYANALGNHFIILNSTTAAVELLEQRSAIYSDRPYMPMAQEPEL